MRNNETGEFELVVGNRQLLSGFFIVVLLFAVAFAMGYVVGQNTQRPAKLASERRGRRAVRPTPAADSRPQPASPARCRHRRAAGAGTPRDSSRRRRGAAADYAAGASDRSPAAGREAAPQRRARRGHRGFVRTCRRDRIWQVIAVKPEVAEAMRQTLKDKGFQVSLTPGDEQSHARAGGAVQRHTVAGPGQDGSGNCRLPARCGTSVIDSLVQIRRSVAARRSVRACPSGRGGARRISNR